MNWVLLIVLPLASIPRIEGSVCLHDDRLLDYKGEKKEREFVVPGYYYDRTLAGIFAAQERSGSVDFKPVGKGAHEDIPEDDHDPENDEAGETTEGPFIALAFMLGILVTIILARLFPRFPTPLTTLFFGMCFAIFNRFLGTRRPDGEHFLNLDSESVIYGLTPVLILGEILKLDVRLAKRLVAQFFFYGLIGGVVNTMLTMVVLAQILPEEYGPEIRLCLAALICTADASFISRILHGAGVPHRLIILIEGESMANDPGLFSILYLGKVLYERIHLTTTKAVPTTVWEGAAITMRIVFAGVALGAVMGVLTLGLIHFTSNRFHHENRILQIVITVVSCYATFFLAEGVFGMSGALAVVSSGWILAWKMWPKIISEHAMTSFWHSIDLISESLLYFVCGFYIGVEAFEVQLGKCIGLSFIIWSVALGCRFATMYAAWPLMNRLGPPLNPREIALWAWSCLKSRIGLALIIEFSLELLNEDHYRDTSLSKRDIIFIIGCVFLISNVINGLGAGLVARALALDRVLDFEERLKSFLFRNALFESLRSDQTLARYLKHTLHFTEHGHSEIQWSTIEDEEVVATIRSVFLSVIRSLYWAENSADKISIRALQSLLTATDHAREDVSNKGLSDFYHLMVTLPPRETVSSQYRIMYTLCSFVDAHEKSREIIEKDVFDPLRVVEGRVPPVLERAWAKVAQESRVSEEYARQELSIRFNRDLIAKFLTLRRLNISRIETLIEDFVARGIVSENDTEESHEAFVEDLASIKATLRAIGTLNEMPEDDKFLVDTSESEVDKYTDQ
jgi:NhaP-type Na+/H+ or K+/H+ antiporter